MIRHADIIFLMSAAPLLAVWGCAADSIDAPDTPAAATSPCFAVTTDLDGESSAPGVTTTHNIREFKVTATTADQYATVFPLDNVIVHRTGLNSWDYEPKISWPANPVTFYMVSPIDADMNVWWWESTAKIFQYNNTGTSDLLAAVNYDMTKQEGPVRVNFRHTLARISADMRTTVPDDYIVQVKAAYLETVPLVGHYTWPSRSTTTQNADDVGTPSSSGTWDVAGMSTHGSRHYMLSGGADKPAVTLPPGGEYYHDDMTGEQFMIPFKLEPLRYENYNWLGTSIIVEYAVFSRDTGRRLWPTSDTPAEYIVHGDGTREWGLAPFGLSEVTPGSAWLSGINYKYRLTLSMPGLEHTAASRGAEQHRAGFRPECDIEVSTNPY